MRRFVILALPLFMFCILTACSTSNQGPTPLPERDASGMFAVTALEGQGSYTPELSIVECSESVAVTITATGATELSAACMHLAYDPASFTPERVEFGDFLGSEDEAITLGLTNIAEIVPIGITQVAGSNAVPATGTGELATVYFSARPFDVVRTASGAPSGIANEIDDLFVLQDGIQ